MIVGKQRQNKRQTAYRMVTLSIACGHEHVERDVERLVSAVQHLGVCLFKTQIRDLNDDELHKIRKFLRTQRPNQPFNQ